MQNGCKAILQKRFGLLLADRGRGRRLPPLSPSFHIALRAIVLRSSPRFQTRLRWSVALPVLVALLSQSGCVYRRLTIRTNPPGAIVEVNGKRIGTSPASMDFTYYGTYDIKLSKPGFETLAIKQPVAPPWYQIPPLDAVSDNLIPVQVTNRHDLLWNLQPLPAESFDDNRLRDRGQDYRSQARTGG
ncbi:MAG: PEGA domain-containing protein [Planctomycetaceae bacterium]|nr:PEGA domain-containing protein [Planctomycetaceae bacterium]